MVVAILVTLGVFVFNLAKRKVGKSALSVDVVYDKARVLINSKEKGETPEKAPVAEKAPAKKGPAAAPKAREGSRPLAKKGQAKKRAVA